MKDATDGPPAYGLARSFPMHKSTVISQRAGKDTLIYDPAADAVHLFNPAAKAIWDRCDGCHSPAELAAHLAQTFAGASGRDLTADVRAALATFAATGLLCPADSAQEVEDGSG